MSNSVFGEIKLPAPLRGKGYGTYTGEEGVGGLIGFISNILKVATIAAGLFTVINLITAGYGFLTAGGNPENIAKASSKIWMSLIGLIIIVSSYTLAAIFGWILFGDATAILKPKIYGPGI